jgi:alpha-beta hydrolase superfamily lysophospholipase
MQTHLQDRSLKEYRHVRALFSVVPSRRAVIFIHGFGGDPLATWANFHTLLPRKPEFSAHDVFFYGYDGLWAELVSSAAIFESFLSTILANPLTIINNNLPASGKRGSSFAYDHVLLVGHSLGAVIARWALLPSKPEKKNWEGKVSLVLFAPAHKGADVPKLALEAIDGFKFLKLLAGFLKFKSPLVGQLTKGSDELRFLEVETLKALSTGGNRHLIAKKVIIAQYEKIVSNLKFGDDPDPVAVAGKDHMSVCKPKDDFELPVTYLAECL